MPLRTAWALGLTVVVAGLGAAGCGGSDREALHPDPDAEQPREVSDGPGSPADSDGAGLDDTSQKSKSRPPVSCGSLTCSADEYCEIKCTCCGVRIPDPAEASGSYSCLPLPPECATTSEGVCGGQRTQEIPCA